MLIEIEGGAMIGYCATGQQRDGEQSAKADQERDDPGEDGPIDKEGGHRSEPLLWRRLPRGVGRLRRLIRLPASRAKASG